MLAITTKAKGIKITGLPYEFDIACIVYKIPITKKQIFAEIQNYLQIFNGKNDNNVY